MESATLRQITKHIALYFRELQDAPLVHYLGGKQITEYQLALSPLFDDQNLNSRFSPGTIRRHFQRLLEDIVEEFGYTEHGKTIRKLLDAWYTELQEWPQERFTYFVFAEGLLTSEAIHVGHVNIEPLSVDRLEQLYDEFATRIAENTYHSANEKVDIRNSVRGHYLSYLPKDNFNFYALLSTAVVTYDVDHGREQALQRFQDTLQILRFNALLKRGSTHRWAFGLKDELGRQEINSFALADSSAWSLSSVSGAFPVNIDEIWSSSSTVFAEILKKDSWDRSQLETHIMRAVYWISKATQEQLLPDRLLNLCIGIESLLCHEDRSAVGKTLGERVAFLLYNSHKERKLAFDHVQKIYRLRSNLAHTGSMKSDKEVEQYFLVARNYALWSVLAVAGLIEMHGWTAFESLRTYLDDLKFGNDKSTSSPEEAC